MEQLSCTSRWWPVRGHQQQRRPILKESAEFARQEQEQETLTRQLGSAELLGAAEKDKRPSRDKEPEAPVASGTLKNECHITQGEQRQRTDFEHPEFKDGKHPGVRRCRHGLPVLRMGSYGHSRRVCDDVGTLLPQCGQLRFRTHTHTKPITQRKPCWAFD